MKKILYISFILLFVACNDENASDCLQTAGTIIQQEFNVDSFNKILVHEKIELIITEGDEQKVIVETGENLLPDITVEVVNNEIILTNNNSCNFFRDYDTTKVYITTPELVQIRNASEYNVSSNGVLTFPSLYLISLGDKTDYLAVGDWYLDIENTSLKIWSNGIANFYLTGSTDTFNVNYSNGDTRLEAEDFICKNIVVSQISSNDMLLYPTESITGSILSTGDIILYNTPPTIEIETYSIGKLIIK